MALTGKKKAFADAVLAGKSNKDAAVGKKTERVFPGDW